MRIVRMSRWRGAGSSPNSCSAWGRGELERMFEGWFVQGRFELAINTGRFGGRVFGGAHFRDRKDRAGRGFVADDRSRVRGFSAWLEFSINDRRRRSGRIVC